MLDSFVNQWHAMNQLDRDAIRFCLRGLLILFDAVSIVGMVFYTSVHNMPTDKGPISSSLAENGTDHILVLAYLAQTSWYMSV